MEDLLEKIKKETDILSKAKMINHLLKKEDIKVYQLAKKLEMTPSYLCHLKRLTNLPELVIDGYYSGVIKISHLFLLSRIKSQEKIIKIYEKILASNLTLLETEDLIREELYHIKHQGDFLNQEEKEKIIKKIKEKSPNIEVKIRQTKTKTKVILEIKENLKNASKILKEIF